MTSKTIPLSSPIEANGETLSELTLSEPDLGCLEDVHIKIGGDGDVQLNLGDLHKVVARMANIPPSSAKKIKAGDLPALFGAVSDFLPGLLPTGES